MRRLILDGRLKAGTIVVQKSTDGGVSFDDGSFIGLSPPKDQDKEWLNVDTTGGPYHGNLYLAWT